MSQRSFLLIAVLGLGIASVAAADESEPLRVRWIDALQMARRRHVSVLIAQERLEQALARLTQARSTMLPQVIATTSETRQTRNLDAAGITLPGHDPLVGPFNTFDARLAVTQMLFDAGVLERFRAAKAGRQLSLAELRKSKQDAVALAASLYLDAWRAAQHVELAQMLLVRDQERLRVVSAQVAMGTAAVIERQQAEAALTRSLSGWHAALTEATERRLDFAAAVGLPLSQTLVFDDDAAIPDVAVPEASAVLASVENHPDVEAEQQRLRETQATRAAERLDALPRVSLNADYGASGKQPNDAQGTYAIGAQVSMPLFEGGRRVARVREAVSRVRAQEAQVNETRANVEARGLSAVQVLQRVQVLVRAQDDAARVAATQLALARHRLSTGIGSELDVLDAAGQLAQARDASTEAWVVFRLAQMHVAHAMGTVDDFIDEESP